jgi:hypothetical protein
MSGPEIVRPEDDGTGHRSRPTRGLRLAHQNRARRWAASCHG